MALSQDELDQMLIDAATKGDNNKIKKALGAGADINAKGGWPLYRTAFYNRKEAMKLLLDLGADTYAEGGSAFTAAAGKGHKEIVELLLDRAANIHALGDNALWQATLSGHMSVVELLLDRGADIHDTNDILLRWAVGGNNKEMALLLLRYGADPKAKGDEVFGTFEFSKLAQCLDELKQETFRHFKSEKPSREQCIVAGILHGEVLIACVTEQFTTLIGSPLLASTDKADRQLFKDIWEALPTYWQDQNQNIYMQFIKEGGLNPNLGLHTSAAQRDCVSSGDLVKR